MTALTTGHGPGPAVRFGRVDSLLTLLVTALLAVSARSSWVTGLWNDAIVPLLVLSVLPLLLRQRYPVSVLALIGVVECVRLAAVPLPPPVQFTSAPWALMLAAYEVGVRRPARIAWTVAVLAVLVLIVVGQAVRPDQQPTDGDMLAATSFALDLVLAATGAGVLLTSRRQRLDAMEQRATLAEQSREEEAQGRVAAERLRMARELHDVVAHHLTLVNAQAGVAEYLLRTDPQAAAQALHGIAVNTRQALDELRATVGLLRAFDGDPREAAGRSAPLRPPPGLATLPALLEHLGDAGARAAVAEHGTAWPLSSFSDLAAYRIIQEALTNAHKHAPDTPAAVRLDWQPTGLELLIENGPGSRATPAPGTGNGLLGMRERARAVGGQLDTAVTPDGGFRVRAWFPRTELTSADDLVPVTGDRPDSGEGVPR